MTGVYQVPTAILPGDWAVKLDLANGMHIILLQCNHIAIFVSLLPCSNQSVPSEVFEIYLERQGLPISRSLFCSKDGEFLIFLKHRFLQDSFLGSFHF
jgi:hypothetical protein